MAKTPSTLGLDLPLNWRLQPPNVQGKQRNKGIPLKYNNFYK